MAGWTERITGRGPGLALSLGSVAGALGVASCCAVPLALAGLGLGGAGLALTALTPYQPILLALTVTLLGAGFFVVYRRPAAVCVAGGDGCAVPRARLVPKIALWAASALTVVGVIAG